MTLHITDTREQLRVLFGDPLCAAAEPLLASGAVRDVRILQGGRVVTAFVARSHEGGRDHRVYIQRPHGSSFEKLEAECSCGERGLCTHVAAVAIASTQLATAVSTESRPDKVAPGMRAPRPTSAQRQALYYLFEDGPAVEDATDCLQISLWIGQTLTSSDRLDVSSLCAFAVRHADGRDEFPRYVDEQDKPIIKSLATLRSNGPWTVRGESGAALFRQSVATGRAFWRSLHGEPLRAGRTRQVDFLWDVMPNGEQRLRAQTSPPVHVVLNFEPALYIDPAANVSGELQTSCSLHFLRTYWNRPPVAPEQVADMNEQIAREAHPATFPTLRAIVIRAQPLSSLAPKLVLSSGPTAALHFIYNGLDVDSRSLRSRSAARRMSTEPHSDACWEIVRDEQAERRFRAQLDEHLPGSRQNADAWLAFMLTAAPALAAQGWSIRVEDEFPYRIAVADSWYADLDTSRKSDWFDLRLGVSVEGKQINLLPALVAHLQSARSDARIGDHLVVRLDDGRYLPVPLTRIERIAHTLIELHEQSSLSAAGALSLPLRQASRIAQLSVELDTPQLRSDDDALRVFIQDIANFSGIPAVALPPHFPATLRPYQHEGVGWLQFLRRHRLGGLLADDMGLGKTVQTLAHLATEKAAGRLQGPSLIVAPVSVIGNWRRELDRFAPELRVVTLHGSKRKELFAAAERADVVLTGYSLLQIDGEFLSSLEFCFLILDEAQTIKNPRAKVSQVARALRARHRLCLTGTPLENHLGELWSLFDFLQPGLLGDEREFQRCYRTPIERDADDKRAQALGRRIAPFVLRRTKEAVARDLPPKTQIVESLVLEESQRDFYDGIRLAMHRRVQEVIQEQGLARSHITVLDALLKLRQACCDPRLIRDDAETRNVPSAKLDWLRTVLPELAAEGRRILLFSQFTSMLRLIEAVVAELSIPYCMLTGDTRNRTELVQRFQSGAVPLFLISLKAGGVGLNLTAADTIIHYDPWWNPAVEAQATDRAHRIGQEQPVFVYKLIAQGTIEEKIMQLQADKHALASQLYAQHAAAPSQWSAADIEALFSP